MSSIRSKLFCYLCIFSLYFCVLYVWKNCFPYSKVAIIIAQAGATLNIRGRRPVNIPLIPWFLYIFRAISCMLEAFCLSLLSEIKLDTPKIIGIWLVTIYIGIWWHNVVKLRYNIRLSVWRERRYHHHGDIVDNFSQLSKGFLSECKGLINSSNAKSTVGNSTLHITDFFCKLVHDSSRHYKIKQVQSWWTRYYVKHKLFIALRVFILLNYCSK